MHYFKYVFITILLYAAQVNAIHLTNNLEKIDKKQIVKYLNNQPFYERQSTSNVDYLSLAAFVIGTSYFTDGSLIAVPVIALLSFLLGSSKIKDQLCETKICNTYYNNILKSKYLANIIDNNLTEIETFLYKDNKISSLGECSDNIIELFSNWIVLYRRDLRQSFFSAIDREKNYKNFDFCEIMDINRSVINKIDRYDYLKKIKFNLIENNQTVKTDFLASIMQQNCIYLLTNNNQKYVGIIKDDDTYYLLFGIEFEIPEEKKSNNIMTTLKEKIIGSDYIDPKCAALVMKFNVENIKQNIVPFLYSYFGAFTKVDLYEVTLNNKQN